MVWQVRLLAWLHIAFGGLGLLIGAITCASLAFPADPAASDALAYIGGFFLYIVTPLLLPALVGGIGLLRRKQWGRVTILILSGVYLLIFPLGTALGAFGLWALLATEGQGGGSGLGTGPSRDIAQPARNHPARNQPPSSGRITWRRGALTGPLTALFLAVLVIAAAVDLVLAVDARISGEPASDAVTGAVPAAIIVVLLAVIAAGLAIGKSWRRADRRRHLGPQPVPVWQQLRDTRIAELRANPVTAKYIPLVERGEEWTDAQIAYNEDPAMLVTCRHLQPIEQAMRRAAIRTRPIGEASVRADCCIEERAIGQLYHLQPPVYYMEYYQGERSAMDFPTALLACRDCRSTIAVLHPDEAKPETPIFPAAAL